MRIQDSFTVNVPIEQAWQILLDVERVAPCMPGAELQAVDGDVYHGICKVKLGAITAQFNGTVRFAEVDEVARRVVMRAQAREARGQGNASATITATLREADGGGTEAEIDTDLSITGRMAQFGRGVMADVSTKLLGEFARRLEDSIIKDSGNEADADLVPASATTASPDRRTVQSRGAEPVDLFAIAGPSVVRLGLPLALGGVLALLAITNGRGKRVALSVVGAALVAALVATERRGGRASGRVGGMPSRSDSDLSST